MRKQKYNNIVIGSHKYITIVEATTYIYIHAEREKEYYAITFYNFLEYSIMFLQQSYTTFQNLVEFS